MSPEQARGEAIDARTDLFSFGVVLYEMATGRRPFQGETTAVIFDAILNKAPARLTQLRSDLPIEFEVIVQKALEKDRDVPCQTASELRADFKRLKRNMSSRESETIAGAKNGNRFWKWIAIPAYILLVGTIAILLVRNVNQDLSRYRYTPFAINPEGQNARSWSPDGKSVSYSGFVNGHSQVFVRSLNSPDSTQLTANRE
jgi:serine/threonine protein kinase